MYAIRRELYFAALQQLHNNALLCANEHTHNWLVKAIIGQTTLGEIGSEIDFSVIKETLMAVLNKLVYTSQNLFFNSVKISPTLNIIVRYIIYNTHKLIMEKGNNRCV